MQFVNKIIKTRSNGQYRIYSRISRKIYDKILT